LNHILQIFTGNFGYPGPDLDDVRDAVKRATELFSTEDVILGWSINCSVYAEILHMLKELGKRVWLWLPMFSELPDSLKHQLSLTIDGQIQKGVEVIKGEEFQFVCPSNNANIQNPVKIYREHFSHLPFDGVFLDKIRHNSFCAGLESGLGCYCPSCKNRFESEGIDIDAFISGVNQDSGILLPSSYEHGRYSFSNFLVDSVYKCKSKMITEAVHSVSSEFRSMGLSVSLDVFAPLLAYFVGQDIYALSEGQSFVKPMMYRITNAPAGIPFELQSMQKAFLARGCDPLPVLRELWGTDDLLGEDCTMKQIDSVMHTGCAIYPGFEINNMPGICDNSSAYVWQSRELYDKLSMTGIVLSWNLLCAPEENIRALL